METINIKYRFKEKMMIEEDFYALKKLIKRKDSLGKKALFYYENAIDPQIKQYFEKIANVCMKDKEKLINRL